MPESMDFGAFAADGLAQAIRAFNLGPVLADRCRHVLWNVNHRGDVIGRPMDGVLAEAIQVLLESGRAFRYGNEIVLEQVRHEEATLVPLALNGRAEPGAEAWLSNLMVVDSGDGQIEIQAGFPSRLARSLLADEGLWRSLPTIEFYSHRPVFDRDYSLCRPGYHADSRILVHGPAITPILHEPSTGPATPVIDRLPPGLGKLFSEFCWRSEADLVNAVGYLLGGLLVNHFVDAPHPVALVRRESRGHRQDPRDAGGRLRPRRVRAGPDRVLAG